MHITRQVIEDLLPVYAAGEASDDTVALVEEFLRQDPQLARAVAALRANPLPGLETALPPEQEKEALTMTKKLLRWRGTLMGAATFLSLLPMSFHFDDGRITWMFMQDMPRAAVIAVCLAAVASWGGFFYTTRKLRATGL